VDETYRGGTFQDMVQNCFRLKGKVRLLNKLPHHEDVSIT